MTVSRIETKLGALIHQLQPAARTKLARQVAQSLRQAQQARIRAQISPDGTTFAPRKPQLRTKKGALRRQMFSKLRSTRYLKATHSAQEASIEFIGRVQRLAQVHHFGLEDKVTRTSPKTVRYAARPLLGITQTDEAQILELVIQHLAF